MGEEGRGIGPMNGRGRYRLDVEAFITWREFDASPAVAVAVAVARHGAAR